MEEILKNSGFTLKKSEFINGKFKKVWYKISYGRSYEINVYPQTKEWKLLYSEKVIATGTESNLIYKLIDYSLV
ncbi:MAG TPA: hypothetical protein VIK55_14125 [Paludibacter sp.]